MGKRTWAVALTAALFACGHGADRDDGEPAGQPPPAERDPGMSPSMQERATRVAAAIRETVSAERMANSLKALAATPSGAGRQDSRRRADLVYQHFLLAGLQARIDEYEVLIPEPLHASVEVLTPVAYRASLQEEPLEEDYDTHTARMPLPHLAFSADGEAVGRLVYVRFAQMEDFEFLESEGVELLGAIGIARETPLLPPGDQVRIAERKGLAALILYSDPADTGYGRGAPYPRGRYRPDSGASRDTALPLGLLPGDPASPGRAAIPPHPRTDISRASQLPRIPCTTLSGASAAPILKHLRGPPVPADWQGGLPLAYHLGGAPLPIVRVHVESVWERKRIWNVVGMLRGNVNPESWIAAGCYRDAFGCGAAEAGSGTALLIEAARVLGSLADRGLPLSRSVMLCSFDAHQQGLLGCIEFAEHHRSGLAERIEMFINLDQAVTGDRIALTAHPALRQIAERAVRRIWLPDPPAPGGGAPPRAAAPESSGGRSALPFEQILGVPTLDLGSRGVFPVRGTLYDTYGWMKRFGDPGFQSHRRMAELLGQILYECSGATVCGVDFIALAEFIGEHAPPYAMELPEEARRDYESAISRLVDAARRFAAARARLVATDPDPMELRQINDLAGGALKILADDAAVPGQPLFRNLILGIDPRNSRRLVPLPGIDAAGLSIEPGALEAAFARLRDAMTGLDRLLRSLANEMEARLAAADGG